jgi:hypothetical protein
VGDLDKSWLEASPAAHIPRTPVADIPHIPRGIRVEGELDSGVTSRGAVLVWLTALV